MFNKKWAEISIITVAIAVRIVVYLQNRSFIGDEAALLQLIHERSYRGLFEVYAQFCPPLFAVATKFLVSTFWSDEFVARALPLIFGILALFVFNNLSKKILTFPWAMLALSFIAFGGLYIRYSSEMKQYSLDAFLAIFFINKALGQSGQMSWEKSWIWVFGGCVAIWSSMPIVFILAGIAAFWVYNHLSNTSKNINNLFNITFIIISWAISFMVYYFLILHKAIQSPVLQTFHNEFFLAFPPHSAKEWLLLQSQLLGIFDATMGQTTIALILSVSGFLIGCYTLWKQDKAKLMLLITPMLLCLIASSLGNYSLMRRLMLFLFPLVLLIVLKGWEYIENRYFKHYYKLIIAIPFAMCLYNYAYLEYFYKPLKVHDNSNGLWWIAQKKQPDDGVFVHETVSYAYQYYATYYKNPLQYGEKVCVSKYRDNIDFVKDDIQKIHQAGWKNVWFIFDRDDDIQHALQLLKGENAIFIERKDFYRTTVLLYRF